MRSLQSQLSDFANATGADVETVVKKSLIRVSTAAESKSPVDKGHFKRSWMSAFGSPDTSVNNTGTGDSIGRLQIKMGTLNIGEIFYFTNSQPYALKLEYGYSHQSESGMVRISAREFPSIVQDEIRQLT